MIISSMYIAVDFDGTLVEDAFPEIGKEIPYAVDTVKFLIECGHKIILHTSRTHYIYEGHDTLAEAEQWCKDKGIDLYAVNDNPECREKYFKQTKVYADFYIDDHNFGIASLDGYVDWRPIRSYFETLKRLEKQL